MCNQQNNQHRSTVVYCRPPSSRCSLATHTGLAERVKEKIDSEEFLQVLELEQRILTGGGEGGRYLEEVEDLACCGTVSLESILPTAVSRPTSLSVHRRWSNNFSRPGYKLIKF